MFFVEKIIIRGDFPENCSKCHFYVDAPDFLDLKCSIYPWKALNYPTEAIPDWCPLVSKGQLKNIIVKPNYDNAWDFVKNILDINERT